MACLSLSCSVSLVTVEYFVPLTVISVAYARIAFRLWLTKTPGAAQDDRDHNIMRNKKKVRHGNETMHMHSCIHHTSKTNTDK